MAWVYMLSGYALGYYYMIVSQLILFRCARTFDLRRGCGGYVASLSHCVLIASGT